MSHMSVGLSQNQNGQKMGFTLVETMVYIALLASLLVALSYYLVAVSQFRAKAMAISEVTDNGRMVMIVLADYLNRADNVDWSHTQIGAHPGVLALVVDGSVVELSLDENGSLLLTENNQVVPLTSNTVRVTNLVFNKYHDRVVGVNFALRYWPQAESKNLIFESAWQNAYHLSY